MSMNETMRELVIPNACSGCEKLISSLNGGYVEWYAAKQRIPFQGIDGSLKALMKRHRKEGKERNIANDQLDLNEEETCESSIRKTAAQES